MDYFNYSRRQASEVYVGGTPMGGTNPIRVQSMTNTPTTDTEACVEQAIRIIEAGGEYVRLTTQGTREAENLKNINIGLRSKGYGTPLIADVHFNPKVAEVAALYAEGVRINPGNYTDAARTFKKLEYTDEEYAKEIQKIRERLVPFLDICKENHTAIRIGVNHGSLSDRIMSRYGDTPAGMVESCMEFLRICVEEQFTDVVISIKASNTVIMVKTVRLLVAQMEKEGMARHWASEPCYATDWATPSVSRLQKLLKRKYLWHANWWTTSPSGTAISTYPERKRRVFAIPTRHAVLLHPWETSEENKCP